MHVLNVFRETVHVFHSFPDDDDLIWTNYYLYFAFKKNNTGV